MGVVNGPIPVLLIAMLTRRDQPHGRAAYPGDVPVPPTRRHWFPASLYFWLLTFVNLALIVLALLLIRDSAAINSPDKDSPADLPKEAKAEIDIDALNPYGQAIARTGLIKCAAAMNDISAKLLQGKRVGVYRFPTVHETFVSLSMEVNSGQGAIIYITFNLTQDMSGACHIAYEAVSDWANPCDDVIKTVFTEFEPTRNLLKSVALLTHKDDKNRKIFTMPVQNGCIAIEKQIISTKR
jgi:hypothetical protein